MPSLGDYIIPTIFGQNQNTSMIIFSISLFFHETIRVPNGPPPEAFVPVPAIASARRRLWDVPRWKASRVQAGEGWVGFRSTFPFLEPQGQPFINGCFNWMIPNLYIGIGWKSPFPSIYKWLFGVPGWGYTLGLPPTQDSSHHQDYYIFSRESQPKPSFATVTGRGVDPRYTQ